MANRVIKFRAWHNQRKEMFDPMPIIDFKVMEINGHVLMQFTGLTDKEGKEIFEGDICTAKFKTSKGIFDIVGKIVMDEFMWCLECEDETYSINRPHDFKVIGNIYEPNHPETQSLIK